MAHLLFNKNLAKVVERYVHTGDKLYVEGRIRYRSYDDKRGQRKYYTEIDVENMEILSQKSAQANGGDVIASEPLGQPSTGASGDNGKLPF